MEELFGELESLSNSISNWSGLIDDDNKVESFILKICQLVDFINEEEQPAEKLKFLYSSCELLQRCFGLFHSDAWTIETINQSLSFFLYIFKFCQNCKHNTTLNSVAEDLSNLFQVAYKYLKLVTVKLDNISESHWDEERKYLNQAFKQLVDCSLVLRHLDIMACVPMWKQMKKMITEQPCNDIDDENLFIVASFFDSFVLSTHAMEQWNDASQQGDMETTRRSEKVAKFMLSLNMQIIVAYKKKAGLDDCNKVLNLVTALESLGFQAKQKSSNEGFPNNEFIKSVQNFTLIVKPFISEFIQMHDASSSFNYRLMDNCKNTSGSVIFKITSEILHALASCDNPLVVKVWIVGGGRIISSILEMVIRRLLVHRENDTLNCNNSGWYEELLVNTCFFVAILPGDCFNLLEDTLLGNLLENQSSLAALFVSDVWCFVARWGSEDLCWQHFQYLGRLLLHYDSSSHIVQHTRISSLFKRIFWFLPSTIHSKIPTVFRPSKETIALWSAICPWNLDECFQKELATQICHCFLDAMATEEDEQFNDQTAVVAINSMVILTSDERFKTIIENEMKERILNPVLGFWNGFEHEKGDIEISEKLVVSMLHLIMNLFSNLDQQTFIQMLSCISKVVVSMDSEAVQLQCCRMLAMLKNVNFPSKIKDGCLEKLSTMFSHLLLNSSWLVQTYAMKALKDYAEGSVKKKSLQILVAMWEERKKKILDNIYLWCFVIKVTSYPKVLSSFLPPTKKKEFAKFLKKKIHLEKISAPELHERTFELLSRDNNSKPKQSESSCITEEKPPNDLTESKRMKMNRDEHLKEFTIRLTNIEHEVRLLKELKHQQNCQIPNDDDDDDIRLRIQSIVQDLKSIPG